MKKLNKNAKRNYKILEEYEAGIVLSGQEVKSVKKGNVDLSRAHAKVINNEIYLINANIPMPEEGSKATRSRKLLLHKDEIISLMTKIKARKLTLVPVSMYNKGPLIKVKLGLAKPKRKFEKRKAIKAKDIKRDIERELKESNK